MGGHLVDEGAVAADGDAARPDDPLQPVQPPRRPCRDEDRLDPASRQRIQAAAVRPDSEPSVRSRVPSRSVATSRGRWHGWVARPAASPRARAGARPASRDRRRQQDQTSRVSQPWVSSARPYWMSSSVGADRLGVTVARWPSPRGGRHEPPVPAQLADRGDDGGGAAGEDLGDVAARGAVLPLLDRDAALLGLEAELLGQLEDRVRVTPSRIVPVSSGVTMRPSLVTKKRFMPPSSSM